MTRTKGRRTAAATAATAVLALGTSWSSACLAQFGGIFDDETALYAETKQVGQFFRRFNGEEGKDGQRYYPGDPLFRNAGFRRDYLDLLFDNEAGDIHAGLKQRFIDNLCGQIDPVFLEFHGDGWFAEVRTKFTYEGRERELTLFMKLVADGLGHKWVIDRVRFDAYDALFPNEHTGIGEAIPFLHPLSHELDFMNLAKIFRGTRNLRPYTPEGYEPDHLTLFIMDVWAGRLQYRTVTGMRFHFFQVDGWYFSLRDVQREGYNTGWLITRLENLDQGDKEALLHLIYHD